MSEQQMVFTHDAMNTTFSIVLFGEDSESSFSSLAMECFEKVDELENLLSRYRDGSDIDQINHLEQGAGHFLNPLTYECLTMAQDVHHSSHGLFDITIGTSIEHIKEKQEGDIPTITGGWNIDPERPYLVCTSPGRQMDLGGIGKGYALDWMLDILSSWGQGQAIVAAGASTQRVMGPQPIKFALKGDLHEKTLWLKNLSLSSSGIGIQDAHIIDPRHNTSQTLRKRAWCITKRASYADAWSTAAMLMNEQELSDALEQNEQLTLVILEDFKGDFTVLGQPTENCRLEGTP